MSSRAACGGQGAILRQAIGSHMDASTVMPSVFVKRKALSSPRRHAIDVSVMVSAASMMANPSRSSASVIDSGGLVKK
jgi:hypothetical protein